MRFFAHQEAARKASRRLTFLFALAVVAVVAAVNLLVAVALSGMTLPLFVVASGVTLAIIFGGTLYKFVQLREGGSAVAEMLGGRRVVGGTSDIDERRLVNVVEEMALASGTPVPLVYVMDQEPGVNAFAAGHAPNDAAIAVTHGLLRALNRDELQGVIAHEFSHILNGDMRLNGRMIGLLHGIQMIGVIGRHLMRGDRRSRSRDGRIAMFGFGLFVIGSVGLVAASLIKAAVSRQREYLADASAVQFTRNPDGIGNALVRIATAGAVLEHRNAEQVSHMCLAAGLQARVAGWLATHPPIEERIERVLGPTGKLRLREAWRTADAPLPSQHIAGHPAGALAGFAAPVGVSASEVMESAGNPGPEHVEYARLLLDALPAAVRTGLATETGAKALVIALLVPESTRGTDFMALLTNAGELRAADLARDYAMALEALDGHLRMPLVELACPALRALPASEKAAFLATVRTLVAADRRITPLEFTLSALLARHLGETPPGLAFGRARALDSLTKEIALVLSLVVRTASEGSIVFERVMTGLGLAGGALLAPSAIKLRDVEEALAHLAELAPLAKPRLIKAFLEVVIGDGTISIAEAELMRALCAALDTPVPPIIDEQTRNALARHAPVRAAA